MPVVLFVKNIDKLEAQGSFLYWPYYLGDPIDESKYLYFGLYLDIFHAKEYIGKESAKKDERDFTRRLLKGFGSNE